VENCTDGKDNDCDGLVDGENQAVCPCTITDAYWSRSNATAGSRVALTLEGEACQDYEAYFDIWEDDTLSGDDGMSQFAERPKANFNDGRAVAEWPAVYTPDCAMFSDWGVLEAACDPPEYYFEASVLTSAGFTDPFRSQGGLLDGLLEVYPNQVPEASIPFLINPVDSGNYNQSIMVNWSPAVDPENDSVSYSLYYSNNSGGNWYLMESDYGIIDTINESRNFSVGFYPGKLPDTEPFCGNGLTEPGEECDRGPEGSEHCSPDCTRSDCGDGVVQSPNSYGIYEQCDDSNRQDDDGCSLKCKLEYCGDGVLQASSWSNPDGTTHAPEECDDGNNLNDDGCDENCQVECGNGVIDGDEECDDGNTDNNDACTSFCKDNICGDGHIFLGNEECDDGNFKEGDGCDNACLIEPFFYSSNMIAYWNFDDGSGDSLKDITENGHEGIIHGAELVDSEFEKALDFSGGDTVEVPDHPALDANLPESVTFETWLKLDDAGKQYIFGKTYFTGSWHVQYAMGVDSGVIGCRYGDSTACIPHTTTPVSTGEWHHVVCTFDPEQGANIYLDGMLEDHIGASASCPYPMNDESAPLVLGSSFDLPMDGQIDEFSMYGIALTQKQVQANYHNWDIIKEKFGYCGDGVCNLLREDCGTCPEDCILGTDCPSTCGDGTCDAGETCVNCFSDCGRPDGICSIEEDCNSCSLDCGSCPATQPSYLDSRVIYLKLDETSGETAFDSSSNNKNGDLSDGLKDSWVPGLFGNGLSFDNSLDNVVVGNEPFVGEDMEDSFTFEAWVRPDSVDYNREILEKTNYNMLRIKSGKLSVSAYSGSSAQVTSDSSLTAGEWYHLASTYDGSNLKIYINGELEGSEEFTGGFWAGDNLNIGSGSFAGIIDEVSAYNTVLTQEQLKQHYNNWNHIRTLS
ncbi:DUF4215 domain-containing protein, partial [Candidatus Woesearchaeota archaeon]|nr:DUF4215 domain-containing protein [Candidatus Woesearchaeota archaeon]